MPEIEVAIGLTADRDTVWRQLSDLESHADWMADAEAIVFLGDQRRGVGTRMEVATRVWFLRTVDVMEVVEWADSERIGVVHRGLVTGTGRFVLADGDQGTVLYWRERLEFPAWLGGPVIAWLAKPVLTRIWKKNLARFRRRVEAGVNDR